MSVFTTAERAYLRSQFLGRLATVGPHRQPHVVPVAFRYNPDLDTIGASRAKVSPPTPALSASELT